MAKQSWKPGNMLYPLPVVMVSASDKNGKDDIITVAWAGPYVQIRLWYLFPSGRRGILII